MKKFVSSLVLNWIAKSGRYDTFIVTSQQDYLDCISVLEVVRRKELNRVYGTSVLDSKAMECTDASYTLIGCRDTRSGKIIGCMRLTNVVEIAGSPKSRKEYKLNIFQPEEYSQLYVFTRLAILKSHRKSPAALWIMIKGFLHALSLGGKAVLMSCEPHLYNMYIRLGLQPLGGLHNISTGGYRIPMICMADKENFKNVDTPALPYLKEINWSKYTDIVSWYHHYARKLGDNIRPEIGNFHSLSDDFICPITSGMSPKGLKAFTKNAITVKCRKDELIIAKNDGARYFGVIVKGRAQMMTVDNTIEMLTPGTMIGELSFILDDYRPYNIVASSNETEILLYSQSALKRISNTRDKAIVWENFAKSVTKKLVRNKDFESKSLRAASMPFKTSDSAHQESVTGALSLLAKTEFDISNFYPVHSDTRLMYSGR